MDCTCTSRGKKSCFFFAMIATGLSVNGWMYIRSSFVPIFSNIESEMTYHHLESSCVGFLPKCLEQCHMPYEWISYNILFSQHKQPFNTDDKSRKLFCSVSATVNLLLRKRTNYSLSWGIHIWIFRIWGSCSDGLKRSYLLWYNTM